MEGKKDLIHYGIELERQGLTTGTGGNLSLRNSQGQMLITPSSIEFTKIKIDNIAVMDDDRVIEGDKKPSSEWYMHKLIYDDREDIKALIHAHTEYSTIFSVLREDLPASHYMLGLAGKNIKCADYAIYGSEELGENALKAMEDRKAVLLANHGILVGGSSLKEAFDTLIQIEYCAKLHFRARAIGDPYILTDDQMEAVIKKFNK